LGGFNRKISWVPKEATLVFTERNPGLRDHPSSSVCDVYQQVVTVGGTFLGLERGKNKNEQEEKEKEKREPLHGASALCNCYQGPFLSSCLLFASSLLYLDFSLFSAFPREALSGRALRIPFQPGQDAEFKNGSFLLRTWLNPIIF
jgi:hypothetical protein